MLDGAAARLRREHNDRAWLAWHVAALGRVKKMPPLRDIVSTDRTRRRMSAEELEAATREWLQNVRHRKSG